MCGRWLLWGAVLAVVGACADEPRGGGRTPVSVGLDSGTVGGRGDADDGGEGAELDAGANADADGGGAVDAMPVAFDARPTSDATFGDDAAALPDATTPDATAPDATTLPDATAPDAAPSDAATPPDAGGPIHVHIHVSNTCVMQVVPPEISLPRAPRPRFAWHNHSVDYPVDVWMSYGGGFLDLTPGATWNEPVEHCIGPNAHDEWADISAGGCAQHRFLIHCL